MTRHLLLLILLVSFNILNAQINEAIKFKITSPSGGTDETIIRLSPESSSEFDPFWDAWKGFTYNDNIPSLYSETSNHEALAINAIQPMQKDTIVELKMRTRIVGGTYTMQTFQQGSFPPNIKIAIKDVETGLIYELNQDQTFTFDVNIDPINDYVRFEVFYSAKSEVTVADNDITLTNLGSHDWNFQIYDSNQSQIVSGVSMVDSAEVLDFGVGSYTAYVTDAYNLVDTLNFFIDYQNSTDTTIEDTTTIIIEDTTSNSTASIVDVSPNINAKIMQTNLGFKIDMTESNINEMVNVSTYTLSGQLINYSFENAQNISEIILPTSGIYIVTISVLNNEQATFKVPFYK